MIGPWARIILRYGAGALVAYGLLSHEVADGIARDPDLAIVLGGMIGLMVEGFYLAAKRRGWTT